MKKRDNCQRIDRFFGALQTGRGLYLVLCLCLGLLVIENVDSYVADFLVDFNTTNTGVALFLLIFAGFIFCEFCLMNVIRMRASAIRARSRLVAKLQLIIPLTQYILKANILLVVFQILIGSEYSVMSLVLVTFASNIISAIPFLVFAIKFLSWYRNPDHNAGILLFTSTFVIL